MLKDVVMLGGLVGFVVAVLEASHRLDAAATEPLTEEAAVREAMRGQGADAAAVRAEFRRRGIQAAPRRPPIDFGV